MNITIKNVVDTQLARYILSDLSKHKLTVGLLLLNVVAALAVVHWAQLNRQMVIQQDVLLQQRDDIDLRWRHLLLEQRALAEHSRVENIARERLEMDRPTSEQEVVVTLP
ncbi:cell division protein FtsL [Psychrosphaera haliotis]|uniref:Cell division protein FtsL n=1 Tax=Psychrosphaera haliotis TaxID=555083 RepID=A0A6N8F7H6_9GAMM|nr:cell division protein FtsL [Psychrosphaera haliotis]MDA8621821.1 cell division protein FtsL [Psychrosphaera sp.]MDB2372927.1 cell division protein FtsL [Psychrosphaera haliotis]MUH72516.1 cell division protein FtsL [Psychrosphaera haliotis]